MKTPTPHRLLRYVTRSLRLQRYLEAPGDGRVSPQIPAQAMLWAILLGQILRESSFQALESLVGSARRRSLGVSRKFGDDALGYFTERLDPAPTRRAAVQIRTAPSWDWPWMEPPPADAERNNVRCAVLSAMPPSRLWAIAIIW